MDSFHAILDKRNPFTRKCVQSCKIKKQALLCGLQCFTLQMRKFARNLYYYKLIFIVFLQDQTDKTDKTKKRWTRINRTWTQWPSHLSRLFKILKDEKTNQQHNLLSLPSPSHLRSFEHRNLTKNSVYTMQNQAAF